MAPPGPVYPQGPIDRFPAEDLRHARRFITSHNSSGQGVFLKDDDGAHHRVMVNGNAVANIIYSTNANPVDMNDDKDLAYARDNEVRVPSTLHRYVGGDWFLTWRGYDSPGSMSPTAVWHA